MSDAWQVLVEQRAGKHLARMDPVIRRRIAEAIDGLTTDPELAGLKPLRGMTHVLRIRVGDYRILYRVRHQARVVEVIDIDHRRDIYR